MSAKIIDQGNNTVQTTDATPTVALTYAHPSDTVGDYTFQIVGMDSGESNAIFLDVQYGVLSNGSTTTAVGGLTNLLTPRFTLGAALWSASVSVSGGNVVVTVTGGLLTTVNWFVVMRNVLYTP